MQKFALNQTTSFFFASAKILNFENLADAKNILSLDFCFFARNCERCNRFGKCEWAATLEVIQFRTRPPIDCLTVNDGLEWDMNARKAADSMKKGNIKIE